MSKYRFAGVVKEITVEKAKTILKFVPNNEYVSTHKNDKEEATTYAILQSDDKSFIGYAFEYRKVVTIEFENNCTHMSVGMNCELSMEAASGVGIVDVTFTDILDTATLPATKNKFAITSIRAL